MRTIPIRGALELVLSLNVRIFLGQLEKEMPEKGQGPAAAASMSVGAQL